MFHVRFSQIYDKFVTAGNYYSDNPPRKLLGGWQSGARRQIKLIFLIRKYLKGAFEVSENYIYSKVPQFSQDEVKSLINHF